MSKKAVIIASAVLFSIGLILLVVLLPLSYSIVELDEYAIYYSNWSPQLSYNEDYSESGRHFVGINGRLVTFPRTKLLIQFKDNYNGTSDGILAGGGNELQAWTKEGANVYIEASYYFSLNKQKLLDLYNEYADNWLGFIVRLSFTTLKAATVKFETNDFVTRSHEISAQMEKDLAAAFTKNFLGAVVLDSFQLMKLSFDTELDTAINSKLIQAFMTKSFLFEQNISITKNLTARDVQFIDNNVSRIMATQGRAKAITYEYEQLGQRLTSLVGNMTTHYGYMKANLTATGTADIWKYMFVTELKLNDDLNGVKFLDNTVTKVTSATGTG